MNSVIVQPMYLPWVGYFGMIDVADVFVFFDDVQFVERSWQRRNKMKLPNGKWMWLSVPVKKNFGQKIDEVLINDDLRWRESHWTSIRSAYTKAPFFEAYRPFFEEVYTKNWEYLVELNIDLISKISGLLGIHKARFVRSSEFNVGGKKTDRLINIVEAVGADAYISGPAAKSYIEIEKFRGENIDLYWFEFNHPTYTQLYGGFIPHLSVIDLMFNVGPDSLSVIRKGAEGALKKVT